MLLIKSFFLNFYTFFPGEMATIYFSFLKYFHLNKICILFENYAQTNIIFQINLYDYFLYNLKKNR